MKTHQNYLIVLASLLAFNFNIIVKAQESLVNEDRKRESTLCFIENKGQFKDDQILYKFSSQGLNLLISEGGVTFQLFKKQKEKEEGKNTSSNLMLRNAIISVETIKLDLFKGKIEKENIIPQNKLNSYFNYFSPKTPDGVKEVKKFQNLLIKDVYKNIDWKFYISKEGYLKYDFIVREGGDYKDILLQYSSLSPLNISEKGELILQTNIGKIKENKPVSFYKNRELETTFNIRSQERKITEKNTIYKSLIYFEIDSNVNEDLFNSELVIDPQINWSTFFGGTSNDEFQELKSDSQGNLYGAGLTWSNDFLTQDAGVYYKGNIDGNRDIVISKFNNDGELIWSTYYGGSSIDEGYSLEIDYNDNLFVTGVSISNDFPLEDVGGYFQNFGGVMDAFVLKFDSNGNRIWATMLGGSGADVGNSIASDSDGNIIVVGWTSSTDYPTEDLGGTSFFEGNYTSMQDIFITKFNADGIMYWSTYFGAANDVAKSVDTDSNNSIFITGATSDCSGSWTFQDGGGYFQNSHPGGQCDKTFILKFSEIAELQWSTYIAGSGFDIANSIIVDKNDDVILLGHTNSLNFPTMDNGTFFQPTNAGGMDLFISKFDNIGEMIWSTYYGGEGQDVTTTTDNLSFSECNNIYLLNRTNSNNLPFQIPFDGGSYSHTINGGANDKFLSVFCPNGNLFWNTYLGGDGDENKGAIDVDVNDNIFISTTLDANSANASSYSIVSSGSSFQENNLIGDEDIYLMKIVQGEEDHEITKTDVSSCGGCDGAASISVEGLCLPISYYWSNGESTIGSDQYSNSISGLCAGTYSVTIVSFCDSIVDSIDVISVGDEPDLTLSATDVTCYGFDNGSATVEAVGNNPFTYEWIQIPSTDSIVENLSPGNYIVEVTDNNGCTSIDSIEVFEPDLLEISLNSTPTDCNINNGTAQVIPVGGTSGYSFEWNPGGYVTANISSLGEGTYSVIVTDDNGCQAIDSVIVESLNSPIISIDSLSDVSCWGGSDGYASINVNGGVPSYDFQWSPSVSTTNTASGLSAGTYILVVTDNLGCEAIEEVIIAQPDSISIISNVVESDCGQENGSIEVFGNGGTSPYTYNWLQTIGDSSYVDSLSIGNYQLEIIDDNGCSQNFNFTVDVSNILDVEIVPSTITIEEGGSIDLESYVDPFSTGLTYEWFPTEGLSCSDCSNPIASPDQTTAYTLIVSSIDGCVSQTSVVINVIQSCQGTFLPSMFSPNGDGNNDHFCLLSDCVIQIELKIYDRWGELLFTSSSVNICWDGTYRNELVESGSYVYKLNAVLNTGESVKKPGNVTVIY